MARISKAEHGRILHLVDTEHRKVAEVAVEYGCTPANIYALLSKLRRAANGSAAGTSPTASDPLPSEDEPAAPARVSVATPPATDLFAMAAPDDVEKQPAPPPEDALERTRHG